jgi:hypothetical protein
MPNKNYDYIQAKTPEKQQIFPISENFIYRDLNFELW